MFNYSIVKMISSLLEGCFEYKQQNLLFYCNTSIDDPQQCEVVNSELISLDQQKW